MVNNDNNRYNFSDPAAAATDALSQFLVQQQALKRQAMLDAMNQRVQEQQIAASKENTDALSEQRKANADLKEQALGVAEANMLTPGQHIAEGQAPNAQKQFPGLFQAPPKIAGIPQMSLTDVATNQAPTTTFTGTAAQLEKQKKDTDLKAFLARPDVPDTVKQFIGAQHASGDNSLPYELFQPKPPTMTPEPAYIAKGADGRTLRGVVSIQNGVGMLDGKALPSGSYVERVPTPSPNVNVSLGDGGIDMAAKMYAKTGVLPALGMGNAPMRAAILNRAALYNPTTDAFDAANPTDVATNKASYGADTKALAAVQTNYDAVTAFSRNADKNSTLLEDVMKNVPNTGIPWLNTPVRNLSVSLMGNTNMAKLNAIRQSVQNEYSRINSQANLTQVLSDTARKEYESILAPDATPQMMVSALHILQQESSNRQESYKSQIAEIKGRIKGGQGDTNNVVPAPPAAPPVALSPDQARQKYGY